MAGGPTGNAGAGRSQDGTKAVVVTWYERLSNLFRGGRWSKASVNDLDLTGEYPAPSSLHLIPGVMKLRVGVVSTVGNVRPQNEDNFYVPGQKSVIDGG